MFRDIMSVTCFIDNQTGKKLCLADLIAFMETAPTTEEIQDIVGLMTEDNIENGITVTYDDATGKLNFDVPVRQEVFIGTPAPLPTHPAIIFDEVTIGGETVYQMRVNVP